VILSEGIALRLEEQDLKRIMPDVERDEHGHIRLGELNLDGVLADLVKARFRERGIKVTITPKNIGYELRCAPPIPFDIEYTRDLGYGAIDYLRTLLREGRDEVGAMITIQEEQMVSLPFGSFSDPQTGRPRVREVNIDSGSYRVATEYMLRLELEDLEDPGKLRPIAEAARLTPDAFIERYGYLVRRP
jgi:6-phosphofructokinase